VSAATVRFARYPGESARIIFAPLLIAIDRGYFSDEGITVEVTEPEDHPWAAIVRGAAEAGVGYIDYGAWPEYRGHYKAVAVQERLTAGRGLPALLARAQLIDDGTLRNESGLRGRKIGLADRKRGDDYLTYFYPLRRGGLTFDDVQIVPVPHAGPERDAALERGDIDLIMARRPREAAAEVRRGHLRQWRFAGEIEPDFQNRFIIYGNDFIARSPEVGRGFLRAHQRGVEDYIAGTSSGNPSAAFLPYLAELSHEKPELLTTCAPGGFPADARIDVAAVERDIALIREAGLYPADVPVSELIDAQFTPQPTLR
jgi:ABC-type nitrate/sulfonate/bicarbonate transport system substrate-binding protein